jgi:tRNA U34 5-methylaminomethyl-2-thiouridine-forming methyltransferase MnmC
LKQIITTSDGSHTIYVSGLDDHYHSVHGAVQESNFIFIANGFEKSSADPLNIFEVGFGTGLNALLTALKAKAGKREVRYTSIEKYPLDDTILSSLNHYLFAGSSGKELYSMIHTAAWDRSVPVCRNFNLHKIKGDIKDYPLAGKFDLIFFDAFGPEKQPEMWSREIFESIASVTVKGGAFVTYSAKGDVKRNLKACGFEVMLLPGPPGKRQIIRAIKI